MGEGINPNRNKKNSDIHLSSSYRSRGGPNEEIAERNRWIQAEQKKINDSVTGNLGYKIKYVYIKEMIFQVSIKTFD